MRCLPLSLCRGMDRWGGVSGAVAAAGCWCGDGVFARADFVVCLNPSGAGGGRPRMHDYAICAGSVGVQVVQVVWCTDSCDDERNDDRWCETCDYWRVVGVGVCFCAAVNVALGVASSVWSVVVPPLG